MALLTMRFADSQWLWTGRGVIANQMCVEPDSQPCAEYLYSENSTKQECSGTEDDADGYGL